MADRFIIPPEEKDFASRVIFGEVADQPEDVQRMAIQTYYNRRRSPRKKEFGTTAEEVAKKGYYAYSKNSPRYQLAVSGKMDTPSQVSYGRIRKLFDVIEGDQDFGDALFYTKPTEDFDKTLRQHPAVRFLGTIGPYNTYSYK